MTGWGRIGWWMGWMGWSALALALMTAAPLAAQVEDSTAIRLRDRLRILGLPPGDSSQAIPADSIARLTGVRILPDSVPGQERPTDMVTALRALPGYSVAEYRGTSAEYRAADGILFLYGTEETKATLTRTGDRLQADSMIRFDEARGEVEARGSPVFVPVDGDEVVSEGLNWNLDREEGSAIGARTRYDEGASWIVTGDMPLIRSDLAYGHKTRFTSCELEVPHYHFETDQLKILRGSILVARPVRLYFGDVPVAWLPFVAQSLKQGRASGLLTPTFSINDIVRTSGGYRRRISNVGFYWAMSDYTDAYLAMDWFADTYTAMTGGFQYRWLRQFLNGSLNLRQFWEVDGATRLTLNTNHSWQMSERMSFRMSANYASSSAFVRQNSFDPQEVTRSIDSQGGLDRRFDWGNLSLSANRRQYLSDDRVEMTLPTLNLSLKTVTLFPAPTTRARWFNNMTWSGGGNMRRTTRDFAPDATQNDEAALDGRVTSRLSLGNLSIDGGVSYQGNVTRDLFRDSLRFYPGRVTDLGMRAFHSVEGRRAFQEMTTGERVDVERATLDWNATLGYQQNLIGSTTLTPSVSLSRTAFRADTAEYAQAFVSAPLRVSVGTSLRSDLYGFYPGVGGFERVRHKLSPSVSYSFSPESTPTDLQREVFGSRALGAVRVMSVGLSQTFEAKRPGAEGAEGAEGAAPPVLADTMLVPGDSVAVATPEAGAVDPVEGMEPTDPAAPPQADTGPTAQDDGLRRLETGEVVQLLGLTTSAVQYDFEADSAGFLQGFQTTVLSSTITSHYLRGLSINMQHELFEDVIGQGTEDAPGPPERRFAPHLSSLNFGFSLSDRSTIVRWLGLGGGGGATQAPPATGAEDPAAEDELGPGVAAESSIIPRRGATRQTRSSSSAIGSWSANLNYALSRPRSGQRTNQTIQGRMSLRPTEGWEMQWNTGYDIERNEFLDHSIRLVRDLHRWQANFTFVQTASGNWRFTFDVSLLDNRDLQFDYEQRSLDTRRRTTSGGN